MQLAVVIAAALEELEPEEREIVSQVRWLSKPRPELEDLERGVSPGQLGSFWGVAHERGLPDENDLETALLPPIYYAQGVITLFLENIRPLTAERVRVVFLHELAHALGYEEDEIRGTLGLELGEEDACRISGC